MKISPSLIGKISGLIAVIVICIPLFIWLKSNYSIKGRIQVDTGAYINPARNVDVKLILGSVDDQLQVLVNEYESYRDFRKEKTIESILEQKKQSMTNSSEKTDSDTSKEAIKNMLASTIEKSGKTGKIKIDLSELDDEERELVTTLVAKFYQNSNYCRDQAADCPIGALFYEKGSLFWENKADNLIENKRIVFDEIATNYVTTWAEGGLGGEPVQIVETVIVTNITIQEIKAALGDTSEEEPIEKQKQVDRSAILLDLDISTNDILEAVTDLKRDLQQKYRAILSKSDDLIIEMILDQVITDENGNYIFKGKTVKPGKYFIASQYDILSSEGERVEFSWFNPVTISLGLAINKSSVVNLDELNQAKPPVDNIYIPDTDELLLDILDGLKKKIDEENAEINSMTNTIQTLSATNVIVSETIEQETGISQSNSIPEINIINIIASNDEEIITETLESTNQNDTADNK